MDVLLDTDVLKYYNQDIFAKSVISIFYDKVFSSNSNEIMKELFELKKVVDEQHAQNIVVKNALKYFFFKLGQPDLKKAAAEKKIQILQKLTEANSEISKLATKKIKPGSTVFIHSINNQIYDILDYATKHKQFYINTVEHLPFSFGRYLSKKFNTVRLFSDLSLKDAIKTADLVLMGSDLLRKDASVVAKTGSIIASQIAKDMDIPSYVCLHSWKYDSEGESDKLLNHKHQHTDYEGRSVYEVIPVEHISGVICEYGVFKTQHIFDELRYHNKWMFI